VVAGDPEELAVLRLEGIEHPRQVLFALADVPTQDEPVVRVLRQTFDERAISGRPNVEIAGGKKLHTSW
jgi:hypothetical protein